MIRFFSSLEQRSSTEIVFLAYLRRTDMRFLTYPEIIFVVKSVERLIVLSWQCYQVCIHAPDPTVFGTPLPSKQGRRQITNSHSIPISLPHALSPEPDPNRSLHISPMIGLKAYLKADMSSVWLQYHNCTEIDVFGEIRIFRGQAIVPRHCV